MKTNNLTISNESKLTIFGGVNVIESDDLLFEVADKFVNYLRNIVSTMSSRHLLTKLTDHRLTHLEVQVWKKGLSHFKK
ncbi:MAG: hypothetical protein CM15mP19_06110 [Gammaproteobacteria bacterium]|nr:MAG: hypothetical protein CM15mP19_06110 [Gammaproteobacteria bacterium]